MLKKKKNSFQTILTYKYQGLYFVISFILFFFFKEKILNNYLVKVTNMMKLPSGYDANIKLDEALVQENMWLREALQLPQKDAEHRKFGLVTSVIFSNSYFFVKFENVDNIEIESAVYFQNRLIGFVEEIKSPFVKVRPITHHKSRFSVQTTDDVGILLVGNGSNLSVEISNSSDYKDGSSVLFNDFAVGYVYKKNSVIVEDFARIKCVYILQH